MISLIYQNPQLRNGFDENKTDSILIDDSSSEILNYNPRNLLQNFQIPNILFIVNQENSLDPNLDQPFYDYMTNNLSYLVTLHQDNNSYDYSKYDAVIISQSISELNTISSLSNVSIPILTMEPYNYADFRLAPNRGTRQTETDIVLINTSSHYIIDNLPSQTISIYNESRNLEYLKDFSLTTRIDEITSLATEVALQQQAKSRTLIALDKGKLDWFGIPAYERRVFWAGSQGAYLTTEGWEIFNKSLHWVLYDDTIGTATINVDVFDLNNQPLVNAKVNLLNVITSQTWELNSSISGKVSFLNIPYGLYNISIQYQTKINNSLSYLEIVGSKTYETETNFNFSVNIESFIDSSPPIIQNIDFINQTKTFSADIYDSSSISIVNLNLTVVNETTGLIILDGTYNMRTTNGFHYFNDSALVGISANDYSFNFNITAKDIAGNVAYSSNQSVNLADSTPPTINEYNATKFGNGTVLFYANISDTQSTVHEVTIQINSTNHLMQLNSTGFWIYSSEFEITSSLNFTIYSVIDANDNEGGLITGSLFPLPDYVIIALSDNQSPHIFGVTDTFSSHENGFVEITAFIDDWNEYQSGVNKTNVFITLFINNVNITNQMIQIGSIVFSFSYQFNYKDNVSYYITAYDNAGNLAVGNFHGNFTIDDTSKPIVNYEYQDFGNGTIEFSSYITDWPSNQTNASFFYTQNYFGSWSNLVMNKINDTYYSTRINGIIFQSTDLWYYIIANDTNGNSLIPTPDQYLSLILTDKVNPIVNFSVENSTINDGETTVKAYASDPYGASIFLNNTFNIKFITSQTTFQSQMTYDSFFTYTYTHSFIFGETVTIEVTTQDDAGNFGNLSRIYIIPDKAPPKISEFGIINHQNGSITVWAEVLENPFGSGLYEDNSSVILEYIFKVKFIEMMNWNGTGNYYTKTISGFEPGDAIPYNIRVIDKEGNVNSTPSFSDPYLLFIKPNIISHGVDYGKNPTEEGKTKIWVEIDSSTFKPTFTNKPKFLVSIIDYTSSNSWINRSMTFNGSLFVYEQEMAYQHDFSYGIIIEDLGTIAGAYKIDPIIGDFYKMPDIWAPIIHKVGIIQLDESKVLIWANISDSGSNVSEVAIFYDFESADGSLRLSSLSELKNTPMEFNGSLYVATISLSNSGKLKWGIMASDNENSIIETQLIYEFLFIGIRSSGGFEELYLFIIIGIIAILIFFVIARIFSNKKRKRHEFLIECNQKLDELEKIYLINVQNADGLPIIVQKSSVNPQFNVDPTILSGYVSATSSVRKELITQMNSESVFQDDSGIIAKIEQSSDGKLNIISTNSSDIIFLTYTSSIPSQWWQELQIEAHKSLIKNIKPMIGKILVDESIQAPALKAISSHIPLVLLEMFSIFPDVPINGNSSYEVILKRVVLISSPISHKVPKMSDKRIKKEYKKFIETSGRIPDYTIQTLRTILANVLNLPLDEVFKIIWESAKNDVFKKINNSQI